MMKMCFIVCFAIVCSNGITLRLPCPVGRLRTVTIRHMLLTAILISHGSYKHAKAASRLKLPQTE